MPIPEKNTIRIFGNLPRGYTIKEILTKANVDSDYQNNMIIPHPYVLCTVIAKNADGETKYDISCETPRSLTSKSNNSAINLIS
jgi:hypothetical protein